MTRPRPSTPLRNLALAAASTLLFAGLIEGAARLLEPPPVQKEEYLWDWNQRFKNGEFYTLEKGEGYPPNEETSVDGLRDATRAVETRAGLRRIMILGDSVVYGHGVEAAEAFPQILERSLRREGRDVEVFNVALPGWSTRQERLAYEEIGRKYRPDAVVVGVCLNDLAELQINLAKPPGFLLTLFKHSATVRLALGASRREIGAVEELFSAPDSKRVSNAFALFFDEVRSLRRDVVADGATFHLVVFPFRFQVEPGSPPAVVQARISDFAAAEGIDFHDLLPEFKRSSEPPALFLDYDHFSVLGHRTVAAWLGRMPAIVGPANQPAGAAESVADADAGASESVAVLRGGLSDASSEARRELTLRRIEARAEAARAAGGIDPALAVLSNAVVSLAVDDPSPRVRFEAARAVFALGLPDAISVEALIRGVRHDDPRVRAFATWTLGEMGSVAEDAIPALVALAKMDGGAGRTGALTAIGKIGGDSPETVPLLLEELKHPKEARRYRAARTLGRMGEAAAAAVPGLQEALKDPSPLVRLHAVRALGDIGEAAKAAVPALVDVLNKDPDPEVRKEVSRTLSRLPGR